jgi:hypothetical protein
MHSFVPFLTTQLETWFGIVPPGAAQGGHVECLNELLRIGIPVQWLLWRDQSNGQPTQYAAHHGKLAFLLALAQATQRSPREFASEAETEIGSQPLAITSSSRQGGGDDGGSSMTTAERKHQPSRLPSWRRPLSHVDWADVSSSRLPASARGGTLLSELAADKDISEDARAVAADAVWHYLTAAYQRLAFATIFHGGEDASTSTRPNAAAAGAGAGAGGGDRERGAALAPLHVRGGVAETIDVTARLPRAGERLWLSADDLTVFDDVEIVAGWVEVLLPCLSSLVGASYARSDVARRFRGEGGWAWRVAQGEDKQPCPAAGITQQQQQRRRQQAGAVRPETKKKSGTQQRKRSKSSRPKGRKRSKVRGAAKVLVEVTADE